MKLSEFRKIIDALDDEAKHENSDDNIVLELDKDMNDNEEVKVGIGDIFRSKLSKNTVKLTPEENVKKPVPPKEIKKDRDPIIKQTTFFCPDCGKSVGAHDKYCRHCGQELIPEDEGIKIPRSWFRLRKKK